MFVSCATINIYGVKLTTEIVKDWFGEVFSNLAPELQELHLRGGVLQGNVEVELGDGIAGLVGKKMSKKFNIPGPGINHMRVIISHDNHFLYWDRQFNQTAVMKSKFKPVKTIVDGYWLENTGSLEMMLTVDVKDNGWYWRSLGYKYRRVPIPRWLFPNMKAYKRIEAGGYKFYVGFSLPFLGHLFSYSGILKIAD